MGSVSKRNQPLPHGVVDFCASQRVYLQAVTAVEKAGTVTKRFLKGFKKTVLWQCKHLPGLFFRQGPGKRKAPPIKWQQREWAVTGKAFVCGGVLIPVDANNAHQRLFVICFFHNLEACSIGER